jgi:hypothetical protein
LAGFFQGLLDARCQKDLPARLRAPKPAAETKGVQASEHAYVGEDGIDRCMFEKADGFISVSSLDDIETFVAQVGDQFGVGVAVGSPTRHNENTGEAATWLLLLVAW